MLCLYSLNAGHVTIVCETRLNFAATWRGFRTFSIPKEAVMIQKKNPWFAVSALAFGFVGGAISGELFGGPSRPAQFGPTVIEAQEFRLVDRRGEPRGQLMVAPSGDAVVMLYDKHGKLVWVAPGPLREFRPLGDEPAK